MSSISTNIGILTTQYKHWMKDDDADFMIIMGKNAKGAPNPREWHVLMFFDERQVANGKTTTNALYGAEIIFTITALESFPDTPPRLRCLTPNGQLQANASICLGIGEFHPEAWQASLGMCGFIKYVSGCMKNFEITSGGIGFENATDVMKAAYAKNSHTYNTTNNTALMKEFDKLGELLLNSKNPVKNTVMRLAALRRGEIYTPPAKSVAPAVAAPAVVAPAVAAPAVVAPAVVAPAVAVPAVPAVAAAPAVPAVAAAPAVPAVAAAPAVPAVAAPAIKAPMVAMKGLQMPQVKPRIPNIPK
jgi:ubiquitin-protein ligase